MTDNFVSRPLVSLARVHRDRREKQGRALKFLPGMVENTIPGKPRPASPEGETATPQASLCKISRDSGASCKEAGCDAKNSLREFIASTCMLSSGSLLPYLLCGLSSANSSDSAPSCKDRRERA